MQVIEEIGADLSGEHPKPIDPQILRDADRVIVLGSQAQVDPVEGMRATIETWETDEPSQRGIEGEERMRLVRDDINGRVIPLAMELTGQPVEHALRYRQLIADLAHRFDGVFSYDEVRAAVRSAHAALIGSNRIRQFLPVLVERFAREQLVAGAQASGRESKAKPGLLFVCVQNAGRSQMAAALARHLSGDRVNVRSAGSAPSGEVNEMALRVLAERGVQVHDAYSKPLSRDVMRASDVIVTMGCGDECPYFPGKRYEDWAVADPDGADLDTVRAICDDIAARVEQLLSEVLPDLPTRPATSVAG